MFSALFSVPVIAQIPNGYYDAAEGLTVNSLRISLHNIIDNHSWPKSWFDDAASIHSDLFHLYPTDGYVNGRRSNYPFGEVGNASWRSMNGSKVGTNSHTLVGF